MGRKKGMRGNSEEEGNGERGDTKLPVLISGPVSAASDCCQSCLTNKQMRICPKLISSPTTLLILVSIY